MPLPMTSVSKPRCARGQDCVHVRELGSDGPPRVSHEGDFCERCLLQGATLDDVPAGHKELLRAARTLLEEGIEGEDKLVPTLVLSAVSYLVPELKGLITLPPGTYVGSEDWVNVEESFYSIFSTLEAWDIVRDIVVVRRIPMDLLYWCDEDDARVKSITIDVYDRSVTPKEISAFYSRALSRRGLQHVSHYGGSAWAIYPSAARILLRPVQEPELHAEFKLPAVGAPKEQSPFPNPEEAGFRLQSLRDSGRVPSPSKRKKEGQFMAPYNLIPAVVAWYVGNRGAVVGDKDLGLPRIHGSSENLMNRLQALARVARR